MSYQYNVVGEGYCPCCKKEVEVYEEDVGIGSYEFWGQRCVDDRKGYFCRECDEPIDDFQVPDPREFLEFDPVYDSREEV